MHGYIHASYHVAEMAILSMMNTHFFYRYLRYFSWFDLAYAWSNRLFEAWLVNDWFKVELVGDV